MKDPEELAKELVQKFWYHSNDNERERGVEGGEHIIEAKRCAVICCEEVISNYAQPCFTINYYMEVIKQINLLKNLK